MVAIYYDNRCVAVDPRKRVVRVSMETMKIVATLPGLIERT